MSEFLLEVFCYPRKDREVIDHSKAKDKVRHRIKRHEEIKQRSECDHNRVGGNVSVAAFDEISHEIDQEDKGSSVLICRSRGLLGFFSADSLEHLLQLFGVIKQSLRSAFQFREPLWLSCWPFRF